MGLGRGGCSWTTPGGWEVGWLGGWLGGWKDGYRNHWVSGWHESHCRESHNLHERETDVRQFQLRAGQWRVNGEWSQAHNEQSGLLSYCLEQSCCHGIRHFSTAPSELGESGNRWTHTTEFSWVSTTEPHRIQSRAEESRVKAWIIVDYRGWMNEWMNERIGRIRISLGEDFHLH